MKRTQTVCEIYAQALEETDYGYQSLMDAKWVAGRVEFSLRKENLSYNVHKEVASLTPDRQDEILREAERDGLTVRDVRAKVRALKAPISIATLPPDVYRVLYADPPWRYSDTRSGLEQYSGAEDHYPTLSLDEL